MEHFSVFRSSAGLVPPTRVTPSGILELSMIDKLPVLRCNARTLHVFRHGPHGPMGSAAKVIREALAKALVPYYPIAGRLKEPSQLGDQLQVACSGEGVWFVDASANCTLDAVNYFDDALSVPYDKLLPLHPHPQTEGLDPLVLMQVTQFLCDGFVIGLTFCHSICDGLGAAQFLHAVGEFARGLDPLSVTPVWHRDFVSPPPPPQHQQQEEARAAEIPSSPPPPPTLPNYQLEHANIDISSDQINQLKHKIHNFTGQTCSTFEIIAATLWKNRTQAAIIAEHDQEVTLVFFANCRHLLQPPLPKGFYGNCFFPVTVSASTETLSRASIGEVVKIIKEAKARLPQELAKWIEGKKDINNGSAGDPFAPPLGYTTLFLSEWGRLGFNQVDYGWGPPVHVVPIQGSAIIPVGIVGSLPWPKKGIRLMTWCVQKAHLLPFLQTMAEELN